jgi:hypothetical protein
MKNLYETAEVVEAGTALELIQMEEGADPGKTHTFIYECNTCTSKAWSNGTSLG